LIFHGGTNRHWTNNYEGDRYSIIYFKIKWINLIKKNLINRKVKKVKKVKIDPILRKSKGKKEFYI
jgi:hypothetical protein